jgi:hypothetical protein
MKLMSKFEAKSEIELIKIFRFNLTALKKNSLRDKLRALLINGAFMRYIKERKAAGELNDSLNITHLQPFLESPEANLKKDSSEISK